jgi:hypothetical protein
MNSPVYPVLILYKSSRRWFGKTFEACIWRRFNLRGYLLDDFNGLGAVVLLWALPS